MKTNTFLLTIATLVVIAVASIASAEVIITTFATSSGCVGTNTDVVRVPELSCRIEGSSSVKYESNNTYVEAKTYTGLTCAGVPTIKTYQLDICYKLTSTTSVKYGNSETPAPASAGAVSILSVLVAVIFCGMMMLA